MKRLLFILFVLLFSHVLHAQEIAINYDESKVPSFILPELLTVTDGQRITSIKDWETKRRPELLQIFSTHMYGITPEEEIKVTSRILAENPSDLEGKAVSRQISLMFTDGKSMREALLLLYLPKDAPGRVPVFLSYNFEGNQSIRNDQSILLSPSLKELNKVEKADAERGSQARRWPLEVIIDAGYGVATLCYHDIYLDRPANGGKSVLPLFSDYEQTKNTPEAWQAIGAWAWGYSRVLDYLESVKEIDPSRVIVMGHSRQGKAALWAGAQDLRFAIVISNNSGSGGAALSKRCYGENILRITTSFPHWFCTNFNQYADKEAALPFDQHELIALMAPRPVYIASAAEDRWADPKGEFLSGAYAGSVYELYGLKGLGTFTPPAVHQPIMNRIGYHIREGVHDVTDYDWKCYIEFADKHLKK